MKWVCGLLIAITGASALSAGETPWQEVSPDVHMRLVTSDVLEPDGTTWAALEIDMPADTKTYWRVPGETGIPPQFDISKASGISGFTVAWPYPERETEKGYLDHVYYGHLVLPFSIAIDGSDPVFQASMTLGICSDVCVPVSVDFAHRLEFSQPDRPNGFRIRQALASVPQKWQAGPEPLGQVRLEADALSVDVTDPEFASSSLIAELEGETLLFGEPRASGPAGRISFPVYGRLEPWQFEQGDVVFTFMTPEGPFELRRRVEQ